MSVIHEWLGTGFLINHENYVMNTYKGVNFENDEQPRDFSLSSLFAINSPFKRDNKEIRKRKIQQEMNEIAEETIFVKDKFQKLIVEVKEKYHMNQANLCDIEAKELSKKIFEKTNINFGNIQGGNNSNTPLKCKINGEFYLIPPKSRFMCGEVSEELRKLQQEKFNLLIADPPWWNKYIRRLKTANRALSYTMMYNEDIARIPVSPLLAEHCLVAVWCTNSPANINAVTQVIFPVWGVKYAATWYWVKVTKSLEPVCSFGRANMKQPYERIIIGTVGRVRDIPDKQLIVSVPSALHSHKPPLTDVLSKYMNMNESPPKTLELFARYLLPNTTSIGYEPLKWQHISLYQEELESDNT